MYTDDHPDRGHRKRLRASPPAVAVHASKPRVSARDYLKRRDTSDHSLAQPGYSAERDAQKEETAGTSGWLDLFTVPNLFGWLLAYKLIILATVVVGGLAAVAFLKITPPRYTTYAELLVEPTDLNVVADDIFSQNAQRDSQLLAVESKLRLITSGNVLERVVTSLDLAKDPEFGGNRASDADRNALAALEKRIDARRDTRSFLVSLSVWSGNPDKSVEIAKKLIESFQDELGNAQVEGAGRAAKALVARIDDLKVEVEKAEAKVETFKRENGLRSSAGELASSTSATRVNSQVIDARARLILAQARHKDLTSNDPESRLNAASAQSETMTALLTQQSLIQQQIRSQSAVLGPRHPSLLALKPRADAIQSQIQAEIQRVVQASKAELEQAQGAYDRLNAELGTAQSVVFKESEAQLQLRQLEREAQAKASVYESYMNRASEAAQRQRIDATNVRVVTQPMPPIHRSYPPRGIIILAAGLMAGFIAGAGLAILFGLWRSLSPRRAG
jgi:uncharacterized protein involved in exopolysaccharide biosynthesis